MKCEDCKWYNDSYGKDKEGECQFDPPVVFITSDDSWKTFRPFTNYDDRCCEFEIKE